MATILGQTRSPFKTPAYQYVRTTDKVPTTDVAAEIADPICKIKLFNPTGIGRWFIAGFDPETGLAYGVAELHEREAGDFDLNEIAAHRGLMGLPIERDLFYTPKRVSELLHA